MRAKSLLITIFGDALEPRGGQVWLSSLIALARPLGVSERLVRTSVYRLAQEKWLERTASGRRSYYALTDTGRRQTADAEHRIYAAGSRRWDGQWRLVIIPQKTISRADRTGLKKELKWQGFGTLTSDTLIHPTADLPPVCRALAERGLADKAKVFCGHTIKDRESPQSLLDRCFDLEQIAREYDLFNRRFENLWRSTRRKKLFDLESAFAARTLLIHDYRRILLHDPDLPEELLPVHWPGTRARKRCAAIYRALQEAADRWTVSVCCDEPDLLKSPGKGYHQRFSGS